MSDKKTPDEPGTKNNSVRFAVAALAAIAIAAFGYWMFAPRDASFGSITGYAFIHHEGSSLVSAVDIQSQKVVGELPLVGAVDQILISKPLNLVLSADRQARQIHLFDFESQTEVAALDLPFAPERMLVSPDGLALVVTDPASGQIAILRPSNQEVSRVVTGMNAPTNFSFSADSSFIFVSDDAGSAVAVVALDSGQVLDPIALTAASATTGSGAGLSALTRTPNGLYGMVADPAAGAVSIISFRSWAEEMRLAVGNAPSRPYITADGRYMIIVNEGDHTISIVSTQGFDTVATLPGLPDVTSVTTGYFETLAYVFSATEKKAIVIDLEAMTVIDEIVFDGTPGVAVADAEGRRIYVPLRDTDSLAVIDAFEHRLESVITGVGARPDAVTLAESNNYCH